MPAKFFDWLSKLQPRQLLMLSSGVAIFIFVLLYLALTMLVKEPEPIPTQNGDNPTPPAVEIAMESVVVATRNIDAKVILRSNMLELKDFPADSVPTGAVTDITEVVNKPTRTKIFRGDILTTQKVYSDITQAGFSYSIPANCRAVSVSVNDVTGVSGFAKPGDYVDVILVEKHDNSATSRILLQNVLLLSINKIMDREPRFKIDDNDVINYANSAIEDPALATLALKPSEVLQLISASKLGEIYLMLRPLEIGGEYVYSTDYTVDSAQTILKKNEPKIEIIYGDQ